MTQKKLTAEEATFTIMSAVQKYKDRGDTKDAMLEMTLTSGDLLEIVDVKTQIFSASSRYFLNIHSGAVRQQIPVAAVNHKSVQLALHQAMDMQRMVILYDKLTLADTMAHLIATDQTEHARLLLAAVQEEKE